MKNTLLILFLTLVFYGKTQDTINRRYSFPNNQYCIFHQVLTTDSCYYVSGIVTDLIGQKTFKNYFVKLNFNGDVDDYKVVYFNDTLGINNYLANLIKTSDGGFAQLARGQKNTSSLQMFIKYNQFGDTLFIRFYPEIVPQISGNITGSRAVDPVSLIQNPDSSYFASLSVGKTINNQYVYSGNIIAKIDKNGQLLWHHTYFQSGFYNISRGYEMIKYNDTTLIMLISEIHQDNWDSPDYRSRSKLFFFDTLGNITQTKTFTEDTIYYKAIGLTKTIDNGLLYGGAVGKNIDDFVEYKAIITKLTPNFEKEWELSLYDFYGPTYQNAHFETIKPVNDSEFVALGIYVNRIYYDDSSKDLSKFGWLVKFNIHGEVLWERKYIKVPHYEGEMAWAEHILYDIDITADSGFIMVGQSINYFQTNPHPYGQMGWIVKTDKYGCLVPNCQLYDNIDTSQTDTTVQATAIPPQNVLFPNPATTELYYYNTTINGEAQVNGEALEPRTCYIYNLQGQVVQQFTATENNITYIIDISQLASATYIFKVINNSGEVIMSEKFVKVK